MTKTSIPSSLPRYLSTLLAPLIVCAVMQLTWPFFAHSPVSLFLIAVTFCAWYGGLGPGLSSVLISFLLADYLFVIPYYALWPAGRADLVYLVTLVTVGSFISILSELMHRARRRVEINHDSIMHAKKLYRSLANATSQVVWTTDAEGRVLFPVPEWSLITGQNAEEMLGNGWLNALHEDDRSRLLETWKTAHHANLSSELEARIRHRNGAYVSYLVRSVPIVAEKSTEVGSWINSATDITKRKLADERFRLVVEGAPSSMIMVDERGLMNLVNNQTELLFGYDRDELLGQPVEKLVPLRYRSQHPAHRNSFASHPSTRSMGAGRDLYGLRKDGNEVPIEIGLNPIRTDEGAFVVASIIDITERKRAEERFRIVVEAAPSAMLMIDCNGLITLVNNQCEQLFGYLREELLGQPVEILVPERYRAQHADRRTTFSAHPTMRAMGAGRDLYGLRKDGVEVPIEIGLNPIRTNEGAFVLASIIDITERKRADQMLRESEERLHTIIENLSEGLVIADLSGQLLHWNKTGLQMHGLSSEDEYLQNLPELQELFELSTLDGSILEVDQWPLQRIINGEQLANYEIRLRRLDMNWERVFSYGGCIIKEPSGQPLAFVTVIDITETKKAEEKLRRSQEQLAGIIASAMDAVITIDEERRIVLFNGAAERMFLFPADEAIGQSLDRFMPERFRNTHQTHLEVFGKTQLTGRSMGASDAPSGLRADGEEFPIEASISQIESSGRRFFTVFLRDITDRKRAEQSIKEQAKILDMAPVLIRDTKARIVLWNRGSELMFGWTASEALEKITHHLLKTEFPRPLEEIKARLYAHNHWEGELIHTTKDGRRLVIASHWVLHRDEHNKPKAVLEVNNDITERKLAEQEVHRLNEELEQRVADRTAQLQAANKELESFSYSVSHDLRAPLRHINGFSQALLEDCEDQLDANGKNYLHQVRNASQEMAQLIDDVLQLARVTRTEMHREEVSLSELSQSVIDDLRKANGRQAVTVQIEAGMCTHGDKRLLRIVLVNLIGNAWKFTSKRAPAEIVIGSQKINGERSYFVRDNGAGFDMKYVNKLFRAFQRLHTAREFEGTGIGLATVQRIVTRHGGRVWADGKVDECATFHFALPEFQETGDVRQGDPTG